VWSMHNIFFNILNNRADSAVLLRFKMLKKYFQRIPSLLAVGFQPPNLFLFLSVSCQRPARVYMKVLYLEFFTDMGLEWS